MPLGSIITDTCRCGRKLPCGCPIQERAVKERDVHPIRPLQPTGRGLMDFGEITRVLESWAESCSNPRVLAEWGNRQRCELEWGVLLSELRRNLAELEVPNAL